jgi:hypothetical protein
MWDTGATRSLINDSIVKDLLLKEIGMAKIIPPLLKFKVE